MQPDYTRIWPYAIAILAVWAVYRRLRRNFGRQPLRPVRMKIRIGILVFLGCSLLPTALISGQFLAAEITGLAAGVALGIYAMQRTRFQTLNGQPHYLPHTYTGVAVSLLLVGRLAYRLVHVYFVEQAGGEQAMQAFNSPAMARSPLTLGLLFVVVGYYSSYYSGVLWKSKRISPEDLEVAPTSTAAPWKGASVLPADDV